MALNLHFKNGPWHFTSSDVRSQMHKVSIVVAVAYAENFHGGFIQWHKVVICIWCVLFVTSQFDDFIFPNQRFREIC